MRTTLDLPDDLVRQAKILAVQLGSTLRELVAAGLQRELVARSETHASEAVTPISTTVTVEQRLGKRRQLAQNRLLERLATHGGTASLTSADGDRGWSRDELYD